MVRFLTDKDKQSCLGFLISLIKRGIIFPTGIALLAVLPLGLLLALSGFSVTEFALSLISAAAYSWLLMAASIISIVYFVATVIFVTVSLPESNSNILAIWYPRKPRFALLGSASATITSLLAYAKTVGEKPAFTAGVSPLLL